MGELSLIGRGPARLLGAADGRVAEKSMSAILARTRHLQLREEQDPVVALAVEVSQTWQGKDTIKQATGYLVARRTLEVQEIRPPAEIVSLSPDSSAALPFD